VTPTLLVLSLHAAEFEPLVVALVAVAALAALAWTTK
jgi:hypothetical protein